MTPLILCLYAMPLWQVAFAFDNYGIQKFMAASCFAFTASLGCRMRRLPVDCFFLFAGATLLASTILSHSPAVSALGQARVYTSGLLPMCLVGILFYLAASSEAPADSLENLSRHAVIAAVLSSFWGLMQLGGSWLIHPLSDNRIHAGLGSAVYLASFLTLAFPLALDRKMFWQAGLILLAIIFTETRSALIAAGVGGGYWRFANYASTKKQVFSVLVLAVLMGVAINKMRTDLNKADAGRLIVYKTAGKMISENPWFGYGPDLFSDGFRKYRTAEWGRAGFSQNSIQGTAHNDILQALSCGGVFWLLAYIGLCGALAFMLWIEEKHGAMGASLALFTYAKFNETCLPVKVVMFIILGAALKNLGHEGSGGKLLPLATGLILTVAAYLAFIDRMVLWARITGSSAIYGLLNSLLRIYV